ncbi:hypothetical protein PoB_006192800 [Plakobranchus ocellatus]|uniref:Uncharacterized protein n=1 Tax=Plakobranchus ocellatus TaxID=259542 RepID=A0AAV4CU98_9GAST|nr:hypothetical protein PoB_006192800 [Plakobranchus ocellatus]
MCICLLSHSEHFFKQQKRFEPIPSTYSTPPPTHVPSVPPDNTEMTKMTGHGLSGPPPGPGGSRGARTRNRRVPADIRTDSLSTVPPTPPLMWRAP